MYPCFVKIIAILPLLLNSKIYYKPVATVAKYFLYCIET